MTKRREKAMVQAVVPLKSLQGAKQRLADVLSEAEREALVSAMFRDVLGALQTTPGVGGITVVTNSDEVARIAVSAGATVVAEGSAPGLSNAVAAAAKDLQARGVPTIMVVHGDLPLARASDFQALIDGTGAAPSVTIAPCRNRDGSNVMICSPPTVIPFLYGPGSCLAHRQAAEASGITAKIMPIPGLALDIDTPADLAVLADQVGKGEGDSETAKLISGLATESWPAG